MNRIEKRMEELQQKNEKAFVTYMTAGLPDMEGTKALIKAQDEAGIDITQAKRLLGHANEATTKDVYTDISNRRAKENNKKIMRKIDEELSHIIAV